MDDSDTQDMEADYSSIRREENRRYLNAFISLLIHFYFSNDRNQDSGIEEIVID